MKTWWPFTFPQRLKASSSCCMCGTTKVVPCYKAPMPLAFRICRNFFEVHPQKFTKPTAVRERTFEAILLPHRP